MSENHRSEHRSNPSNRRTFLRHTGAGLAVASGALISGSACSVSERTRADSTAVGSDTNAAAPPQYRLVRAEGTYRELGRQHGEQAAEQIKTHASRLGRSREQLESQALRFKPLFERYCPHLLEEIAGLAEGAGITLAESLAVNIRGELRKAAAAEEGCTTFVIDRKGTVNGEILIGQNSDMGQMNIDLGYMLHLKPNDKPQVLIWTFGGMIGYHGMNSAGVAIYENALSDSGDVPPGRFAMPHYPVKRRILECSRLDQVLELFRQIPLASNKNYVMCDGTGAILDVEATTAGPELLRDEGTGFLAHSNHFVCPRYAGKENQRSSLFPDTLQRLDRMNELISTEYGSISVDRLKAFLRDHSNYPTSICRHPQNPRQGLRTVTSMIAEPAHGRMHVALGNPCESDFVTYSMDA